jgi:hypothetical protein
MKKVKKFSGEGGSYIIPSQVRTFAETVLGKRDPITEKNFNPAELQQIRNSIERSRARQQGKSKINETVGYEDYGDNTTMRQKSTLTDFSVLPSDAARNTLGRFRYEKTPEGRLVATDKYDFLDDLVDKNPNIPRSKDYENLSTLQKIGKLTTDTTNPKIGGLSTLPSRIGSAFVGATSRPVRVDLGEAPFKKGGKVKVSAPKRTTSSKRGDGIATKGFTKGRVR